MMLSYGITLTIVLSVFASLPSIADTPYLSENTQRLQAECLRDGVSTKLDFDTVAGDPGRYHGSEFLLTGPIQGLLRVGDHTTYLIGLPNGGQASVEAAGGPLFQSGASICALVKVPPTWDSSTGLDLVDMTPQYDAFPILHPRVNQEEPPAKPGSFPVRRSTPPVQSFQQQPAFTRFRGAGPGALPSSVGGQQRSNLTATSGRRQPSRSNKRHQSNPAPAPNRSGQREHYSVTQSPSRAFGRGLNSERRLLLNQYASAVQWFNPHMSLEQAQAIGGHVIWYSQVYGVDARLIMAIIGVESEFHVDCTSNHGAMGLGQLMPGTARDLGVTNAYDPEQNIAAAVRLIRWHLDHSSSEQDPIAIALACYNAGENAVKRYHGVPPYRETIHYIQKVKLLYAQMCRADGR